MRGEDNEGSVPAWFSDLAFLGLGNHLIRMTPISPFILQHDPRHWDYYLFQPKQMADSYFLMGRCYGHLLTNNASLRGERFKGPKCISKDTVQAEPTLHIWGTWAKFLTRNILGSMQLTNSQSKGF